MNGKKRPHNRTSNYLITTETKKLKKKQQGTLGKLRSNFLGTEFQVFDSGENPKKKVAQHKIRKQLGVVMYETNVLGSRGPRKMKVLLPAIDSHGRRALWRPMNDKEGMVQSYKAGERELIMSFINKPPEWKEQLQAYVLNFNGRVEKASVKNFQLVDKQERKPPRSLTQPTSCSCSSDASASTSSPWTSSGPSPSSRPFPFVSALSTSSSLASDSPTHQI